MYTVKIDLSVWGTDDETVTIETTDFEKIQIIKKFIAMQQDYGWKADYAQIDEDGNFVVDFDLDDMEDEEDDEEFDEQTDDATVTTFVITKIEE